MRTATPALVVCVVGATLAAGSAVALALAPSDRGGHAVAPAIVIPHLAAKTAKAPPPPVVRRERGVVIAHGAHASRQGAWVRIVETGLAGER